MVYFRQWAMGVDVIVFVGVLVLLATVLIVRDVTPTATDQAYRVIVHFQQVGDLKSHAAVTVAGVEIGRVERIRLDTTTYSALVEVSVRQDVPLSEDTFARIVSTGFMGEQYIALDPGGSDMLLKEGSEITLTQGAISVEELLGQFIFNQVGKGLP